MYIYIYIYIHFLLLFTYVNLGPIKKIHVHKYHTNCMKETFFNNIIKQFKKKKILRRKKFTLATEDLVI